MWLNELIWATLNSIQCWPATHVSLVGDLHGHPNHSPLRHLPPPHTLISVDEFTEAKMQYNFKK